MSNKLYTIIGTICFIAFSTNISLAEQSGAGCGIGKVIMEGKKGQSAHIVAAILNDILIPRTTFMSTAATIGKPVLGCDPTKSVKNDLEKEIFVAENMDNISEDIAKGGGIHLAALADVMGIADIDKDNFFKMTQNEFETISSHKEASETLNFIKVAMAQNERLAHYVK